MVVVRVALLASLITLAACDVGEVPIGGGGGADGGGSGPDPMASSTFAANIKPLVDTKGCTAGGAAGTCHGNVQPPVFTSFETLTANANYTYVKKPSTSNKLVVGPASLIAATNMHQGVLYFDAAQKAMIATWIDMYGAP